tara:strand:+ start:1360 stop:1842 length:483 start_codon:yes stop_codon:yes gene_type:complete
MTLPIAAGNYFFSNLCKLSSLFFSASHLYLFALFVSYVGGHCVKVVGWGSEYGKDYWMIANSWASSWGDHGYFRIIRGKNLCGIETGMGYLLTAAQAAAAGVDPDQTIVEVEQDISRSGGMLHEASVRNLLSSLPFSAVLDLRESPWLTFSLSMRRLPMV